MSAARSVVATGRALRDHLPATLAAKNRCTLNRSWQCCHTPPAWALAYAAGSSMQSKHWSDLVKISATGRRCQLSFGSSHSSAR